MKKVPFEERLRILHEIGNELSMTGSVSELCRSAVELGRLRLGLDRISTWFVDPQDPDYIIGSFGVDEKGDIREETAERVAIDGDPAMKHIHSKMARSVLREGVILRDNSGNTVGRGSHIIAAIWNGREVIGYLSTDNLLNKKSLSGQDLEIVELFASTFGHLYSLKKAEEELGSAYGKLKQMQEQVVRAAKMEVVGGLASGVAHEVKNPLAIMLQGIEYLSRKIAEGDDSAALALDRMKGAVVKANGIIDGLLDFSQFSELKLSHQGIDDVLESALLLVRHEIDKFKIKVKKKFAAGLRSVKIDKDKIEQVLVNIFLNSIRAMPMGGVITLKARAAKDKKGLKTVVVEIEDTGPGIPKHIIGRVFDPFFTTRRASGGTGLGLTIARNIMEMHKAGIAIENVKTGHGAKVTLTFRARGR